MTPLGRGAFLVGLVAWIVGIAFGWKEFVIVAAMCAAGLVIAIPFTFGRTELEVITELAPPRVIAGDRAVADFTVRNTGGRRMLPVRLELPVGKGLAAIDVPSLAADETFEELLVIPTSRRSVVPIGPTSSVRGDPLGLMRREVRWTDRQELFVHPRTTRLKGLQSGWMRDLEGQATNDISMSDVAFHTLREYVPGDDRRHVHWRTSARVGTLMVRQFIDSRRSHLAVVVTNNPADYASEEEFEMAISMGASLGLRALADGQEVSCVTGNLPVAAHTGQALLDGMSRVEFGKPVMQLEQTVRAAQRYAAVASVVALVTGSKALTHELQAAAERFGGDARVLITRASLDDGASFRAMGR
ncbi:MAG: DUF58 domain-containing protein, partial [Ilumatobacteraceae bacterium]